MKHGRQPHDFRFGERARLVASKARALGWSWDAIAAAIDVSRQTIHAWGPDTVIRFPETVDRLRMLDIKLARLGRIRRRAARRARGPVPADPDAAVHRSMYARGYTPPVVDKRPPTEFTKRKWKERSDFEHRGRGFIPAVSGRRSKPKRGPSSFHGGKAARKRVRRAKAIARENEKVADKERAS